MDTQVYAAYRDGFYLVYQTFVQLPSSLKHVTFTQISEDVCPLSGLIPKAKHKKRRQYYDFCIFSFVPSGLCNQQWRHRNVQIVAGFTQAFQAVLAVLVCKCRAW
jgi:hypothetical protein